MAVNVSSLIHTTSIAQEPNLAVIPGAKLEPLIVTLTGTLLHPKFGLVEKGNASFNVTPAVPPVLVVPKLSPLTVALFKYVPADVIADT